MKKILKFFPVALAAVALASCSNDELFSFGDDQAQKDPTKLYAQIEDLTDGESGDVTRSGFVYSNDIEKPDGQVFVWTENDKVKLYDDNQNWRPQIWTYDAAATLAYTKEDGFSVFTSNTTTTDLPGVSEAAVQYKNAYGVMPYTLSEFANETRTLISFDFDQIGYYETGLTAADGIGYTPAKLSKAPIPLWGVANGNEMKVKYLTGILKVDINNIENTLGTVDANANTHQFLIIQAEDPANAGNGVYMHPNGTEIPALDAVAFNPDDVETAPVVATIGTGATKTDLTATAMATTDLTAPIANDIIIVDLGNAKGRVCVAVPLLPGAQKVKAYVKKDVLITNPASVDLQNPTEVIPTAKEWTVQAGKYYRIQDPGLVKVSTLNNPYSVAQYIIAHDGEQSRDWTLQLDADVDVKTGGAGADPNNFTLDLSAFDLKHNVTIEFGAGHGFKQNAAGDKLVVKTGASTKGKKLTIVNNNLSTLGVITVDAANAGDVVLSGNFATATKIINIDGPNVTLMDADLSNAASIVNAKAPFAIDCDPDALTTTHTVNIAKGCTKVSLLNGTIQGIEFDATAKIAAPVEIYTEGKSAIDAVSYVNVPFTTTAGVDTYTYDINFTSKWTATLAAESFTTITDHDGAAKAQKFIVTAAQLAKFSGTNAADVILLGSFDLNGSEMDWNAAVNYTSANDFTGIDKIAGDNFGTGQATISNFNSTASGLFNAINPGADVAIQGIKFAGTNTISANVSTGLGLLANTVAASSKDLTLGNITVEGVTITTATGGKYKNIGGLVGIVNDDVIVKNCNVTASLKAYANMGGFFGQIASGTVAFKAATAAGTAAVEVDPTTNNSYKATNTYNAATATFTLNYDATDFSHNYATKGQFAGNIAAGATVTVVLAELPAYADATVDPLAKWVERDGENDPIRRDIVEKQTYFGFSGISDDGTVRFLPTKAAGWVDVVFYGNKTAANSKYQTRTYEVKNATPASPADDGKYFLNYVKNAE